MPKDIGTIPAVFLSADGAAQVLLIDRPPPETFELEILMPLKFEPPPDYYPWRVYRLQGCHIATLSKTLMAVYREIIVK